MATTHAGRIAVASSADVIVHKKHTIEHSKSPKNDYVVQQADGDHDDHYTMFIYEPIEGIPVGLEPLVDVTSINFVTGLPLRMSFDVVVNRNYNVTNQSSQKIYHCGEKTNHCVDYVCNGHRFFELHFFNGHGQTMFVAKQNCSFCLCCSRAECGGGNLTMELFNGDLIGTIRQKYNCCYPRYEILDQNGLVVMRVDGPCGGVLTQICGRTFKVSLCNLTYDAGTQVVATIDKRSVQMPEDLSIINKALLLGCLFLIELDYYQSSRTYDKVLFVVILLFGSLIFMGIFYPDYHRMTVA